MAAKKPATAVATPPEAPPAPKFPITLGGKVYALRPGLETWKNIMAIGPCVDVLQKIQAQDMHVVCSILGHALGKQFPKAHDDFTGQRRMNEILGLVFAEGVEPVAAAVLGYYFALMHGGKTIDEVLAAQKLDAPAGDAVH